MAVTLSALSLITPLAVAPPVASTFLGSLVLAHLVAPLVAGMVVEATRDLTLPLYMNAGTTVKEVIPAVWHLPRKRNAMALLA